MMCLSFGLSGLFSKATCVIGWVVGYFVDSVHGLILSGWQ